MQRVGLSNAAANASNHHQRHRLGERVLPADVVYNDQINTYGAGDTQTLGARRPTHRSVVERAGRVQRTDRRGLRRLVRRPPRMQTATCKLVDQTQQRSRTRVLDGRIERDVDGGHGHQHRGQRHQQPGDDDGG